MAKGLLALAAAAALVASSAGAATVPIKIDGMKFLPGEAHAKPGDTVEWTNADILPHTVTRQAKKGGWDSGVLAPGKTFRVRVPKAGSFDYACSLHPTMLGKVVVGR